MVWIYYSIRRTAGLRKLKFDQTIDPSSLQSQYDNKNYSENYRELPIIIQENGILNEEKFLEFAKQFDVDHDHYLNKEELTDAAKKYIETGLNTE